MTYPGWRGDNLQTNGTVEDTNGLDTNGEYWPYGMQWSYPCGGMPVSTNRTKWPVSGGAVAFQPGWFQGHSTAYIYINLGLGTIPPNMSFTMLSNVQLIGPSNNPYPGSWCFPQLIEAAKHGAGLFNCVDITFAEDGDPDIPEVNATNCFNSSDISSDLVFSTSSLDETSAAVRIGRSLDWLTTPTGATVAAPAPAHARAAADAAAQTRFWIDRHHVALTQIAVFCAVQQQEEERLNDGDDNPLRVYAQEPAYTDVDRAFLQGLGVETVEDPAGQVVERFKADHGRVVAIPDLEGAQDYPFHQQRLYISSLNDNNE
ncbi:hypothetical protein DV738_g1125, partial [Chaetothyriales sp. CBS 135597]